MRERSTGPGAFIDPRQAVVRAIVVMVLAAGSGGLPHAEGPAVPGGAVEAAPDPRAEAARLFPDAPAVALEDATTWSVDGPFGTRRRLSRSRRVLVQSPRGLDQANGLLQIPEDYKVIEFAAESECPGHGSQRVPEDLQQTVVLYRRGDTEVRALKWTHPDTRPGCIVSWRATLESPGATLEYRQGSVNWWSMEYWYPGYSRLGWWELDSSAPALHVELTVAGKTGLSPTVEIVGRDAQRCELISRPGKSTTGLTCKNVPQYEPEPRSGPIHVDRLRAYATLFPDGPGVYQNSFRGRVGTRLGRAVAQRSSLKSLLPAILASAQTSEAKIRAMVRWVRSHVSVTSHEGEPRDVNTVLESGSGDAEERAIVLATMVSAAGFRSSVVWAYDRSFADLSKFYLDRSLGERMLVRVDAIGVFIDLECDSCPAGVVHWRSSGPGSGGIAVPVGFCGVDPWEREGSICSGVAEWLDVIPARAADHNVQKHFQQVQLEETGDSRIEGTVEWYMQEAVARREWLGDCDDECLRRALQDEFGGRLEDLAVTVENRDDVEKTLTMRYGCRARGSAVRFEDALLLRPPDIYSSRIGLPITEERLDSVRWEYAGSVLGRSTFTIPAGYHVTGTLPKLRIDGPGMKFSAEWRPGENAREVVFDGGLMLEKPVLPPSDYPAARRFVAAIQEFLRGGIVLERSPDATPGKSLL